MVEESLSGGRLTAPDGVVVRWTVRTSGTTAVLPQERDQAARLADL